EVKPRRVSREPAVSARRAEVELRSVAVERPARRGDPVRIGMLGVKTRLLGVRAIAGVDQELDAVRACRGVHAVEGAGNVRPHRLAHALFVSPDSMRNRDLNHGVDAAGKAPKAPTYVELPVQVTAVIDRGLRTWA